ncbi:MAG: phosphate signaling complex protein PhoU [Oscillospiraceae bacterium]|nr:phosphate signaling complex protein PhoU [Oscillospiraceae bacterium]
MGYDKDLRDLEQALTDMGEQVQNAMAAAIHMVFGGQASEFEQIAQHESEMIQSEQDIEHRCMTLFLRQQPVAADLRNVSAILKAVTDYARIGHFALEIAEIARVMDRQASDNEQFDQLLHQMARDAVNMVTEAFSAFRLRDLKLAEQVKQEDDIVDRAFNTIKAELAQCISKAPERIDMALDELMIVKYLERVADHAVNVAGWVEFSKTGVYDNKRLV